MVLLQGVPGWVLVVTMVLGAVAWLAIVSSVFDLYDPGASRSSSVQRRCARHARNT